MAIPRSQTCSALAKAWKSAKEHATTIEGELISALAPRVRETLFFVRRHAGATYPITSAHLAQAMNISISDAGNMLKELHEYGLLVRAERTDDSGRFYAYWAEE